MARSRRPARVRMANNRNRQIEHDVAITATPSRVLAAFFDPDALAVWWRTVRAVTTPRPLGVYAVEWRSSPFQDELFGTLGGVSLRHRDGLPRRAALLRGRRLLAAARERRDRPDGPGGHVPGRGTGHPAAPAAGRDRRRRTLGPLLRPAGCGLGRLAPGAQALPGAGRGPPAARRAVWRRSSDRRPALPEPASCPRIGSSSSAARSSDRALPGTCSIAASGGR